ncbi:MAG: hypothetical protein AB7F59_00540 [Bdellovibrionales bacterium]
MKRYMENSGTIFSIVLIAAIISFTSACQKKSDDGGNGAAAVPPPIVSPPAPACVPNSYGQYPSNCVPSQSTGFTAGSISIHPTSRTTFGRLLADNYARLEHIRTTYQQLPPGLIPFLPPLPPGQYQSATYERVLRCGNNNSQVCQNECNNYANGGIIVVNVVNGEGVVTVKAGPYQRPSFLCSPVLGDIEKYYSFEIPVKKFGHNNNRGFSLQSISHTGVPGSPGMGATFRITAAEGTLEQNYVDVTIHYRGAYLGSATLIRK